MTTFDGFLRVHHRRPLQRVLRFLLCLPFAVFSNALLVDGVFADDVEPDWQFNADLSLSSDYIYRGISLSEGAATPQAKAWLGHKSGLFASVWVSKADIGGLGGQNRSRDWEAEYSLGYRYLLNRDWQVNISNAWLEYRQQNLPRNADYQEFRIQLDHQDNFSLSAAYTDGVWNTRYNQFVLAASARQHLPWQSVGELELGLVDLGLLNGDLYHYARVSIGKPFARRWVALLEYHYSGNTGAFFNSARTGSQFLVGLSYHFGR
ncbi:TorF family putative porin [Porticoccus sp. GXU_MW_L64]